MTAWLPWTRAPRRGYQFGWACATSPRTAGCSTVRPWKTSDARSRVIPVDAVLLMCCSPEAVTAGIPILRRSYSGVIGGYPAVALPGNVSARQNSDYEQTGDFLILSDYAPSRLAEFSREWKDLGAQIIGGCCAAGPEHTLAQRAIVKAA